METFLENYLELYQSVQTRNKANKGWREREREREKDRGRERERERERGKVRGRECWKGCVYRRSNICLAINMIIPLHSYTPIHYYYYLYSVIRPSSIEQPSDDSTVD